MKVKKQLLIPVFFIVLISCSTPKVEQEVKEETNPLIGTWKLISATTIQGDSTRNDDLTGKEMIKIINPTHFSFLNHDVKRGEDSTKFFVAGGEKYKLNGDTYTEYLEYCNFREWEGHTFNFKVTFSDDTLVQRGIEELKELGVNREIIETYIKTEN